MCLPRVRKVESISISPIGESRELPKSQQGCFPYGSDGIISSATGQHRTFSKMLLYFSITYRGCLKLDQLLFSIKGESKSGSLIGNIIHGIENDHTVEST